MQLVDELIGLGRLSKGTNKTTMAMAQKAMLTLCKYAIRTSILDTDSVEQQQRKIKDIDHSWRTATVSLRTSGRITFRDDEFSKCIEKLYPQLYSLLNYGKEIYKE